MIKCGAIHGGKGHDPLGIIGEFCHWIQAGVSFLVFIFFISSTEVVKEFYWECKWYAD